MSNHRFKPIDAYLPHKAPMILLDRTISADNSTTYCEVTVSQSGVLAPFLTRDDTLPSWFFVEIMAQTVGVWNGLRLDEQQKSPNIALLLGVRRFTSALPHANLHDVLTIKAELVLFDENLSSFKCSLKVNGVNTAEGSIVAYEASQEQLNTFKSLKN